ncbi:cytochrome b subunit of the bc complex [Moorella thermoacetica Y72]|uniref:Cytochrome b subunit of the bc complex n=1 Tax=Moorella thermoacetica Y72 TaxID=1325331 RepID=A0A0S6UCM9_NEOTH|nr:hypothetical protein [Moorella thermoacetica]GAF25324.1 cytochrome b subunit of the bc complex [Moorella thermoacetica Y72]
MVESLSMILILHVLAHRAAEAQVVVTKEQVFEQLPGWVLTLHYFHLQGQQFFLLAGDGGRGMGYWGDGGPIPTLAKTFRFTRQYDLPFLL